MEEKDLHDPPEQFKLQRLLSRQLAKLSLDLERFNLAEYINLINNPKRFLAINFMGGVARGLGFALGATILGAVALYVLQRMVVLNLPVIGDFIAELVKIVQQHL